MRKITIITLIAFLFVSFFSQNNTFAQPNNDGGMAGDLTIYNFMIDRTELEINQKALAYVTIYNAGSGDIETPFDVTLVDYLWDNVETDLYSTTVSRIGAYQYQRVVFEVYGKDFTQDSPYQWDYRQDNSPYHIYVQADRENQISELNENNNKSENYQNFNLYTFEGQRSDLIGTYMATEIIQRQDIGRNNNQRRRGDDGYNELHSIQVGNVVTHDIKITNAGRQGSILAGPVKVTINVFRVLQNGKKQLVKDIVEFVTVDPLMSSESKTYILKYTSQYHVPGLYEISTYVDGSYLYNPESISVNNLTIYKFTVERRR